jgi:hypothetical protein
VQLSCVCFFLKWYDQRIKTEQKLQQGIHLRFPFPEGFSLGNYLPITMHDSNNESKYMQNFLLAMGPKFIP